MVSSGNTDEMQGWWEEGADARDKGYGIVGKKEMGIKVKGSGKW